MGLTYVGPITSMPKDLNEARKRVLLLYANWLRVVPRAVDMYRLDTPIEHARKKIRSWFEANRDITDLKLIHNLTVKSTMDLIEVHNRWSQRPHMLRLFGDLHEYASGKQLLRNKHPEMPEFVVDFLTQSSSGNANTNLKKTRQNGSSSTNQTTLAK